MVLLQESPLVLAKLTLDLLYNLMQLDLSRGGGSRITLEILNEIFVTTELEYVSEQQFEIVFVILSGMTISLIEILNHFPMIHPRHLTRVNVNSLARSSIDYLLYL